MEKQARITSFGLVNSQSILLILPEPLLRDLRVLHVENFSPVHRLVGSGRFAIHPVHPVHPVCAAWLPHGYWPKTEKRKKERKRNRKGTKGNRKRTQRNKKEHNRTPTFFFTESQYMGLDELRSFRFNVLDSSMETPPRALRRQSLLHPLDALVPPLPMLAADWRKPNLAAKPIYGPRQSACCPVEGPAKRSPESRAKKTEILRKPRQTRNQWRIKSRE
jgi:hypothetical protein